MKVLKLELFQESACYKKPFAFKVTETYPLPPYSTVSGMFHSILKAQEYIPMQFSIQGDYESIFNSYNTMYFYKSNEVTTMPLNTHMLYGVNLTIHIKASEEILDKIVNNILDCDEYFSLGRREDLVRINKVNYIDVEEIDVEEFYEDKDENLCITRPIYIPKDKLPCRLQGISYRLNYKYDLKNDLRQWHKVDTLYVDEGQDIDEGTVWIDKGGDLVFFN